MLAHRGLLFCSAYGAGVGRCPALRAPRDIFGTKIGVRC